MEANALSGRGGHSLEADKVCILCGSRPDSNYDKPRRGQASKDWSSYRTDCGKSFCALMALPGRPFKERVSRGPYCIQCSTMIWDIHLTMAQIKSLDLRLQSLKENVEKKIGTYCEQLEDTTDKDAKQTTSQLIGKELKRKKLKKPATATNFLIAIPEDQDGDDDFDFHWGDEPIHVDYDPPDTDSKGGQATTILVLKEEVHEKNSTDLAAVHDPDWIPEKSEIASHDVDQSLPPKKRKRKPPNKPRIRIRKKKPRNSEFILPDLNSDDPWSKKVPPKKPVESKCIRCSAMLPSYTALKIHMEKVHRDEYFVCKVCQFPYRMEDKLEDHIKNVHGGNFSFYCPTCSQGFNTQEELTEHQLIHKSVNPFTCSICQRIFTNTLDLERHVPTHINPFHCSKPGCKKAFATEEMLARHMKYHTRSVVCHVCGLACHSKGALGTHLRAVHTEERNFRCHICTASYKMKKNLTRHMKGHTGERPFPCRVCGKAFQLSFQRDRHEQIHSGIKPFQCRFCGKEWATQNSLRQHESETHGGKNRGENARRKPANRSSSSRKANAAKDALPL